MRALLKGVLVALLGSLGACATTQPQLQPASTHTSAAEKKSLAIESRSGVTVTGDGNAWHRSPANLPAEVTPVFVTLHNTTGQPVRVQYDEFSLKEPSGDMHAALAPYTPPPSRPWPPFEVPDGGYFDRFDVAPYLAPSYRWLPVWNGPLPRGPSDQSVTALPGLPTAAMLDRALPEGVLENDGTASGFLYFQKVPEKKGDVRLLAVFEQPTAAGEPAPPVASIDIPFRNVPPHRTPAVPPVLQPRPNYSNWMNTLP